MTTASADAEAVPATTTATFKPRDVEELIDFYFHRRFANVVVKILAPLPITPDQVTVISGVVALVAGAMVWFAGPRAWLLLAGAGVFLLSIVLDCADGQLARLRKSWSLAGRMLDGSVDVVSVAGIMVGQFGWLLGAGYPFWPTFLAGWAAGFSLRWHAHTYDHVKNIYLHNTQERSSGAPWFPTEEEIERERLEHERAGRWFSALLCRAFRNFTRVQRQGFTNQTGFDRPGAQSAAERAAYRRHFRVYMRLWSFNGLGTHLFLYTVATALMPIFPAAPLVAWGIVAVPMNLLTLYLGRMRRTLEARLQQDLSRLRAAGEVS